MSRVIAVVMDKKTKKDVEVTAVYNRKSKDYDYVAVAKESVKK